MICIFLVKTTNIVTVALLLGKFSGWNDKDKFLKCMTRRGEMGGRVIHFVACNTFYHGNMT